MSRRLSIPLLVDSVTVDRVSDAREINEHPAVTRGLSLGVTYVGRLINRWRLRRIVDVMEVEGRLLPVFLARDDAERAAEQKALETKLNALVDRRGGWRQEEIAELVGLIRSGGEEDLIGVAVQGLLGRLFREDYRATQESYEAARTIGDWPRVGMLKALWWRLCGRIWRAREEVWRRAHNDRLCIHATAIALHNIVDSLLAMARLYEDPVTRGRISEQSLLGQCLRAPPSLLRRSKERFYSGFLGRPIERHSLLVIDMERIHGGSADSDRAFAVGQWNQCPAHRFVSSLLIEVWRLLSQSHGQVLDRRKKSEAAQ